MKKYLLLLAAGAIALPGLAIADAHGYSQSISGNVRINHVQTTDQDVGTASTSTGGGDTYLNWNHSYTASETKSVTGFIRFQQNGEQRINVTGTATEGDWTATALGEWDVNEAVSSTTTTLVGVDTDGVDTDGDGSLLDDNATVVSSVSGGTNVDQRNQYIQVTNTSGLSIFFGRTAPFDSLKGTLTDNGGSLDSNIDIDGDGDSDFSYHAVSVDDFIDSHFNYIQIGYAMGNGVALSLKLQMDNTGNVANILGYNITNGATGASDISANAVSIDYAMGAVDASLTVGSGSAEGNKDRTAGDEDHKQDLSLAKLGLNYDAGVAQVHLNYTSTSLEVEDGTVENGADAITYDYTGMNLGVSAAAGGGTVILDLTNTALDGESGTNKAETSGSATEVGYITSIGGASFKASYGTGSYDDDNDATTKEDDDFLALRMEYGF